MDSTERSKNQGEDEMEEEEVIAVPVWPQEPIKQPMEPIPEDEEESGGLCAQPKIYNTFFAMCALKMN
jgi:hypothetical protein